MAISNEKLVEAIAKIATIEILQVTRDVVDDVVALADVFPHTPDFESAVTNVLHSLIQIKRNPQIGGELRDNYAGYRSHHYQSKRVNKHPADLRTIYREHDGVIRLHGFGHRHNPDSVYNRFKER